MFNPPGATNADPDPAADDDEDAPAVIPGTLPATRVGFDITVVVVVVVVVPADPGGCAVEMIELVEFDLVGDAGRAATGAPAAPGSMVGFEGVRWWFSAGNGDGGQTVDVGVGTGVFCAEREMGAGAETGLVVSGT